MVVLQCCYLLLCISIRDHNNNPSDPQAEMKPKSGADAVVEVRSNKSHNYASQTQFYLFILI